MIWMEKRVLLGVTGAILVANLLFFLTYRVRYEERVDDARKKLEQAKLQLDVARASRAENQGQLAAHKTLVETISTVYETWWSIPEKRLTKVIIEVRELVKRSGLELTSLSFGKNEATEKNEAQEMTISFGVRGSYPEVRQLVNLIESSDEFIIIDSIALSASEIEGVSISLSLRTLFKGEPVKKKAVRGAES